MADQAESSRDREWAIETLKECIGEHRSGDQDVDPSDAWEALEIVLAADSETELFALVRAERDRQDEKWGTSFPGRDWDRWVTILTEEVGEFAEAVLEEPYRENGEEEIRRELVQVAAVAIAALTFGAPQGSQRGAE